MAPTAAELRPRSTTPQLASGAVSVVSVSLPPASRSPSKPLSKAGRDSPDRLRVQVADFQRMATESPVPRSVQSSPEGFSWQTQRLRGQIDETQTKLAKSQREVSKLTTERTQLVNKVADLDRTASKASQLSDMWQQRCMEMEHECAVLGLCTDEARAERDAAQQCERDAAARALELRIAYAEDSNAAAEAALETQAQLRQAQAAERDAVCISCKVPELREELRGERAERSAAQAELQRLQQDYAELLQRHEEQAEALAASSCRVAELEMRCGGLEATVESQQRETLEAIRAQAPPHALGVLEHSRFNQGRALPDAGGPAPRTYVPLSDVMLDEGDLSARSPPKSRREYPGARDVHGRRLRFQVQPKAPGEARPISPPPP